MAQSQIMPGGTRRALVAAGFLALALVFGGGGSPSPAAELLVQSGFVGALLLWHFWAVREGQASIDAPRSLWLFAGAIIALPILHLLPLPPVLWQAMPGRELATDTLALVGAEGGWRSLSVAPYRTLAGLLAIIPAVALMLAVATLDVRERRGVIGAIALTALAGTALGVLQLASGDTGAFQLYEKSHRGWLTGFFANRNATTDALLAGALALTFWFVTRTRSRAASPSATALFIMLQFALLLGVVLTGSRAGIALIPVALLTGVAMLRAGGNAYRGLGRPALALAGVIVLGLAIMPFVDGNARLAGVEKRFDATRDARIDLWHDSATAMQAVWPVGSGIGTFTRVFPAFERLAVVDAEYPNRAHNDYLEFTLEAGLLAPALLAMALAVVATMAAQARRDGGERWLQAQVALGILAILALHSIVDYPLRTMALAALAGGAIGLLAPPGRQKNRVKGTGTRT